MRLGIRAPSDHGLAARLLWTTGIRLGFLLLFLAATAVLFLRGELSSHPYSLRVAFGTIAASFAVAALFAALLRRGRHLDRLALAQLVFDQLAWTCIVYVSGGATSGATSFYGLSALGGAVVAGGRGATVAALTGLAFYGTLCLAFALGWLAPPPDQSPSLYVTAGEDLVYPFLINALGVTVVALLAGYLAERLRLAGGALAEATARARAAERLAELGRIAAGLAHEIRNPLGSISGSIEMLRESDTLTDEDRRLCGIIYREAHRLNDLVSDMLDLSKPQRPNPMTVDVAAIAQEVVALASRSERSGAGDVAVVYDGPATPAPARCDPAQLRQVLWNLVRNAVQVSGAGREVRVRVCPSPGEVTVSVVDQGPGIPPEDRDRVFDAFYTRRTQGTGIGLAVVKRIIDDHQSEGASILIEDGEDRGSVFRVVLKAGTVRSLPPAPQEPLPRRAGAGARAGS